MTNSKLGLAAGLLALLVGLTTAGSEADARRLGGGRHIGNAHINAGKIARNVHPYNRARHVARDIRRAGRWVNGVWVVNGVAASVAVGTASNCGYYYRKWRETGSAYWHDRYVEHCR